MTTTKTQKHIYTENELRAYLETLNGVEYRIHTCDYFTGESSEDPVAQLFSIDDTVNYVINNDANPAYIGLVGYEILVFNRAGYMESVIF